jgi:LysR family glycine cleavage system transcriptional activator
LRKLPPLNSLKAFDAVFRQGNMAQAARELSVSASAVSQHVSTLEDWLAAPLLLRNVNSTQLTQRGQELGRDLSEIFDTLEQVVHSASKDRRKNNLDVTVVPSLAARWLLKRLVGFSSNHSEYQISIEASFDKLDVHNRTFDLAIRSGHGKYADARSLKLFNEYVSPVCSPQYLERVNVSLERIEDNVLLGDETFGNDSTNLNWNVWMARQGIKTTRALQPTHHFTDSNLTIQAAVNGEGIMLGRSILIADEIEDGSLIYPFKERQISDWPYFIVYPEKKHPPRKEISKFIDWLLAEASRTNGAVAPKSSHL